MNRPEQDRNEPGRGDGAGSEEVREQLSFLAVFYARAHRRFHVPQPIGSVADALRMPPESARVLAGQLRDRGWLREVSARGENGPRMQITSAGIRAVRKGYTAEVGLRRQPDPLRYRVRRQRT